MLPTQVFSIGRARNCHAGDCVQALAANIPALKLGTCPLGILNVGARSIRVQKLLSGGSGTQCPVFQEDLFDAI